MGNTDAEGPATTERPAPEPLQADALRVVIVGTAAFVIALVVVLLVANGHPLWRWTTVAGAGLGLIGMPLIAIQRRAATRRGSGNTDRPG